MESVFNRTMYHTQKDNGNILKEPILCERKDAWLGTAYYFWGDISDAKEWGVNSKNNKYIVYEAIIKTDKILDTVYNEEHYEFLLSVFKQIGTTIYEKTGRNVTKYHLAQYLSEKIDWKNNVDVILMCDIPTSNKEMIPIPYRKRIQAAVYNKQCINDFKKTKL